MTRIGRYLPPLVLSLCSIPFAGAQTSLDVNLGVGGAQDKAGTTGFDGLYLTDCSATTATCVKTKPLSTIMVGVGGNLMLSKKFGLGVNANFQPGKQTYAEVPSVNFVAGGLLETQPAYNLQSQVAFYQADATYVPIGTKKYALRVMAGAGAATVKFSQTESNANTTLGSFTSSSYFHGDNYAQAHIGIGAQVYVSGNLFIRPEFDVHYVKNFTNQFGSNTPKSVTIWLGYSFGNR